MKKTINILVLVSTVFIAVSMAGAGSIKVYLPRQVEITGSFLTLGDVAIIRGSAEDVSKASKIPVGKFSMPGQKITLSRMMIQSRLAANNIASRSVSFSGSKDVCVGRKELVIPASKLADVAIEFINENSSSASIASYEAIKNSRDLVIPSKKGDVTFSVSLGEMVSDVQVSAVVNVMVGGEKVGSRKVHFRPMYNRLRIIAKGDVSAGTVLSAENVRLEKYISRHPEKKAVKLPVGLIAKRNIRAGQVVRNSALAHAKPEILIKRNALVVIKIETPLLKLSVEGKALGEAAFGELIKVRNVDSKRTILCKVNFDGTVSPAI